MCTLNFTATLLALIVTTAGLAGCIQKEDLLIDNIAEPAIDVLRIAYLTQDDYEN